MASKATAVCALALALLVSRTVCAAQSPPGGDAKGSTALRLLLAGKGGAVREAEDPRPARRDLHTRAYLSEDERGFMTKQIMQAISDMVNSECMPNRDYQGWVDFGRRSAE